MDRDERLARLYFDLTAVSVVEDDVRAVMREMKARLAAGRRRAPARRRDCRRRGRAAAGAARSSAPRGCRLEWIERGDTAELRRAKRLFLDASVGAL